MAGIQKWGRVRTVEGTVRWTVRGAAVHSTCLTTCLSGGNPALHSRRCHRIPRRDPTHGGIPQRFGGFPAHAIAVYLPSSTSSLDLFFPLWAVLMLSRASLAPSSTNSMLLALWARAQGCQRSAGGWGGVGQGGAGRGVAGPPTAVWATYHWEFRHHGAVGGAILEEH